jgi:hypothetical protein
MKKPSKPIKNLSFGLLLAATSLGHAQTTTLIGGTTRNGDFNTTTTLVDGGSFAQTPFWENLGTGGDAAQATRSNLFYTDSSRNAQLSNAATNTIIHAQSTEHTIAPGDVFNLSYVWRDAANWNAATDKIRVTLFTTADNTLTGSASNLVVTTSALSAAVGSWQPEALADIYTAVAGDSGKILFVKIDTENDGTTGLTRLDNFLLTVTSIPLEPVLAVDSGDYALGILFHATGGSTTTRTVTFRNAGETQNLTLDGISLNSNGGGVFSITSAPSNGSVIAAGATFDVEITATGGGGYTDYTGELFINTTPDDQDSTFPISANISITGDPFFVIENTGFNDGLASWTGNAAATSGLTSANGARVRGVGDDQSTPATVFADNLSQAFVYQSSPDFTAKVIFAIPEFTPFTGQAPDSAFYDRSFHLAIQADAALPGATSFDDADTANTIINLFYLAAGSPTDTGAGFFLWDSTLNAGAGGFTRLSALGTLLPSTGFNVDGTPPSTLNTYELTIIGSAFGTGLASYDISISNPNATSIAATATGLTVYHGANPATNFAKAVVLTTNDAVQSQTNPDASGAYQPSFWVDSVEISLGATLPLAFYELASSPVLMKIADGDPKTTTFSISNVGAGQDLSIATPVFGDPRFTLLSPALPVNIAPGDTLEFVVHADMSASTSAEDIMTSLDLTTNDAIITARSVALQAQVLVDGKRVLVDYDDGIANGVHEASIRNGGFEDSPAGSDFVTTADWFSRFPEGDTVQLTYDTAPFAIGKYGVASGFVTPGVRAQPVVALSLDEWTLEEGDSFTIEFTWRNGTGFVEGDLVQVIVEIADGDGNPIADPINNAPGGTDRFSLTELPLTTLGTPQTDTITTVTVPAGSAWIGGRPQFRFLKNGGRDTFVDIDNVSVVGNLYNPPAGVISITNFSYNATTNNVTLRWIDGGFGTYTIQSDADLDFTSGTTVYTLDGSEDATTYAGEIEYIFNDPSATEAKNFWRVVGE